MAKTSLDVDVPRAGRNRPAWRRGLLLASSAFLFVGLGSAGVFYSGNLVWVHRLLEHPFVFGCIAAWLMGLALDQVIPWRWLGVTAGLLCVVVALLWGFVGLYLVGWLIPREVDQVPAPGDAEYEVVRSEAADVIDPIWYVSIRQTRGLLSRQWDLGCVSGDDPAQSLKSLSWDGPDTLVVTTPSRSARISIDPETGQPTSRSSIWSC